MHSSEPWILGEYGGICNKAAHKNGHPGPGGPDGCVYEPTLYEGDIWEACVASRPMKKTVAGCDENGPVLSREDARRIVACVNFLAGIPTEALELVGTEDVRADLGHRLEILSKLKRAADLWDKAGLPRMP